ncbi:hypothetical protein COEREDRAFT_89691 [Coemansia reversa NRRL 1564]|uniref:Uncharacterized protein n=1 Tax=Coemansia reversa (strain ATCC 12441 / NRRL 1564) TaxID=763665 RepID=A0A2G5B2R1_COERN|nr:hypothetical protein COEREDRAFT_89691 [Coemansia reversa NRRL 1564]|eukprot:PIA13285.1 hypothetical protein COEREDRAFT_89691 [Coemansia reversa NRRL 1564]
MSDSFKNRTEIPREPLIDSDMRASGGEDMGVGIDVGEDGVIDLKILEIFEKGKRVGDAANTKLIIGGVVYLRNYAEKNSKSSTKANTSTVIVDKDVDEVEQLKTMLCSGMIEDLLNPI